MLAKRVIPVLLADGEKLVKGEHFDSRRVVGHVQQAARVHQMRGVDELMVFDVAATRDGRGPDIEFIYRLTTGCFMPVTVGGGVRTITHIRDLLRAGADKVAICTAAVENPEFIREASAKFGAQAIVVVVEIHDYGRVSFRNGRNVHTTCAGVPINYARYMESLGAGELVLNDVTRDGTMQGYDLDLIHEISYAVDIPVVACGGAGHYGHMLQAIQAGASAVAAGAMFQWTDATPREASQYLGMHGVPVRL